MLKNTVVRARVSPELKDSAEAILSSLGLNATQAITLFYTQVQLRRGLPFEVTLPNALTLKTLEKSRKGEELVHCKDAEDLCAKLGI